MAVLARNGASTRRCPNTCGLVFLPQKRNEVCVFLTILGTVCVSHSRRKKTEIDFSQ